MIFASSNIATYRFAIVGAGDMPIAIPLCCFMKRSPNRIRLLFITRDRASTSAFGRRCGYCRFVCGSRRKAESRDMQSSVSIFVYMETASYVNIRALGGSLSVSSSRLSAREFLKYVA